MSDKELPKKEKENTPSETPSNEPSKDSQETPLASDLEQDHSKEQQQESEEATLENAIVDEAADKQDSEENTSETKHPEATTDADLDEEEDEEEQEDEEEIASSDDEEEDEDSEEETIDYHDLSKKELIAAFKKLLNDNPVQAIKKQVDEIRSEFNSKFDEEVAAKKEEFLAEGGNIIDFYYTTPLKKEFNSLYFDYKEKRNKYYKNLKRDLNANLEKRNELIEELKGLLGTEENINTTYKHFKDIQERWHTAGPIPRDKYNLVWNTYHHHVENFYDFLHLNREFRDLDFKHNLDQKLKLIGRAEELSQQKDIKKAFRELQMLHKMWKEDVGPVAKEYRDEVWDKFSAATKVIHDKRQALIEEEEKAYEQNYLIKEEIIKKIEAQKEIKNPSHQKWQKAIKEVQALRDAYFAAGRVPRAKNKEIWKRFKDATRQFNRTKNSYYKEQKKAQFDNLEKKKELVAIAEANKDSEDFETVTPLMKKIQSDWKKIGHVPRKHSDKIWKEFKSACNHYFDRLHAKKDEASAEEKEHLEQKEALLEKVTNLSLSGSHEEDLAKIKEMIATWKGIGRVPYKKRNIDRKFNKVLDGLFSKLDVSKKDSELIRFDNKVSAMVSQDDERKLKNEHFFISKKIKEVQDEIRQLENNLGFFQHVDDDNPLVKEVHKNIAKQKEQLEVWKAKLKKIKKVRSE